MTFTVYGKPQGKARPRFGNGHAFTPANTRAYEREVVAAYQQAGGGIIAAGKPVCVEITAYYAIPKSTPIPKREMMKQNMIAPTMKPDWDNIGKIVCDALNGVAWADDAQVTYATVRKLYGITPMVCVAIAEA